MSDEQNKTTRNMLSEYKTRLIGRPIDGAKKPPTFAVTVGGKNNITIKIYSNIESAREGDGVTARADVGVAFMLTRLIRTAVKTKGPFKRTIKHEDTTFIAGKRTDKPLWLFDLDVVRESAEGDVKLVVHSYKRPDMEFYFRPTDYHALVGSDGELLNTTEVSEAYATGWCDMLENLTTGILNNYQISLYTTTDLRTVDGKSPAMVFGSIANNPRISVFTKVETDQHIDKGIIHGKLDTPSLYALLSRFDNILEAPANTRNALKNYKNASSDGGYGSREKVHEASIIIGRDENNVIYMAVVSQDRSRPMLQFKLTTHYRYKLLDERGNPVPEDKVSTLMAMVYRSVLRRTMAKHLNDNYTPPDMSTWSNRGNGQNRQYNNNGNKGYSGNGGSTNNQTHEPQVQSRNSPPSVDNTELPF